VDFVTGTNKSWGLTHFSKSRYPYMTEEAVIKIVLDEAFLVHKKIEPGMLESVYKTCPAYRLQKRGLLLETEKPCLLLPVD
jgi:PD-(D/E)XK nuclease superfamily